MRGALSLILLLLLVGGNAVGEESAGEVSDKKQVEALLEELQQAVREKDPAGLQRTFDPDAIIASWARDGHFRGVPEKNLAGVKTGLSASLNVAIGRGRFVQPFESFEIRSVRAGSEPNTLVAYVRLQSEMMGTGKLHLHLTRHDQSLRIFEIDDLETGLSVMAFIGAILVEARTGSLRGMAQVAGSLQRAQALLLEGAFQEAYELVAPAQQHDLPDALHAIVQLVLAAASLGAGEFTRAIDHTNQAAELKPNTPMLQYIRAHAWNYLGEPGRALSEAETYFKAVGDDPDVDLQMGVALLALDRKAEALVPLRRVLVQDGFEPEVLAYFACGMTGEQQSEFAQYFDRLQDPATDFPLMADICVEEEAPQ